MTTPGAPPSVRPLSSEAIELLAQRAGRRGPATERRADRCRARLSPAQQRIWLHDQLEGGIGYVRPVALRIRGALDIAALERALSTIVARHEALHSRIDIASDGSPFLRIVAPEAIVLDLGGMEEAPGADGLDARVVAEAHRPFDLAVEPPLRVRLFRYGPLDHVLLAVFHHVAFDGWSVAVYLRELASAYGAAHEGRGDPLGELALQCGDLAERPDTGASLAPHYEYWRTALAGADPSLNLPLDHPRHLHQARDADRVEVALSADHAAALREFSRAEGVTVFMTVAAALEALLFRYTGQEDFLIGTPIAGRTRPETQDLIGCFINTLALRADLTGSPSFRELVQRVRRTASGAFAHQALPFEEVVRMLDRPADRHVAAGVQVLFNFRNLPLTAAHLTGLDVERVDIPPRVTMFDLELDLTDTGSDIRGTLVYPAALIDPATACRMAGHLRAVLQNGLRDPGCAVADLPVLSDDERQELLGDLSGTDAPIPDHACIHHLIAEHAARAPGAVAISGPAGEMTYQALVERARDVTVALTRRGVTRGDRVGLAIERSPDLIAAMLGVMAAGAAYVPLDPEYPDQRLAFIISDASLHCIVTDRSSAARLSGVARTNLMQLDEISACEGMWLPGPAVQADGAYVIYTSGSTGAPKGAVISHRALLAFSTAIIRELAMSPRDRFLQFSTPNFDASIIEIFPTLATGATVVLRDAAMAESAAGFLAGCTQWGVTMAVPSTAFWHEVVGTLAVDGTRFSSTLRLMAPGGERMLPERAAQWSRLAPGATLLNAYGPTETTVHVTRYQVPPGYAAASGQVPIGRPIANTHLYVVDRRGNLLPRGAPGELRVGGAQLADGYLGRPELTAERFVPNPFGSGRLYRTGDLVRWRNDGNLEFLGRLDRQVKVRGFRVEIGEIESAMLAVDGVVECAVEARESPHGDQRLVGYLVLANGSDPDAAASVAAQLRLRLPAYMQPLLVPVPVIPRTPNGKLDRAALPALDSRSAGSGAEPVAPRTPFEAELVRIWERLLDVSPVGVTDDFFLLGGHSLLAMRMVHEVQRACGCELPLSVLFDHSTIEAIAAELERASRNAGPRPVLNRSGTRPPLIFFHGDVLGAGLYCRDIARRLGPDQPVYLVGPPHEGGPSTIEATAAAELKWIRDLSPRPRRFAGFCNGGVVAFEVARQLERAGEHVEFVFMIDAPARNVGLEGVESVLKLMFAPPEAERSLTQRARVMRVVADLVQRVRMFGSKRWSEMARATFLRSWNLLRTGRSVAPEDRNPRENEPPPATELSFVGRAVNAYVPRRYGGHLHVVVSTSLDGGVPEGRRWEQRAGGITAYDAGVPHGAVTTAYVPDVLHDCLHELDVSLAGASHER